MPKLPVDLIFFDLDGTLTDSIPPAIESIQKMLAELKFPLKSIEEINQYVGFGEIPLISGAIGTNEPKALKIAMEVYFKHYTQEGIKKVPLYPHAREILDHFKNKTNIILSNKRDEFIRKIIQNLGLENYFQEILGGDTSPCLKPDPCTINNLLEKYAIPPERAILIGDMQIDVQTGKNAGIHTCGVTYGFDGPEKIKQANPNFIISDLLGLKDLLE